jgi:hypothetical protein
VYGSYLILARILTLSENYAHSFTLSYEVLFYGSGLVNLIAEHVAFPRLSFSQILDATKKNSHTKNWLEKVKLVTFRR